MKAKLKNQAGFTLTEMLAATLIVAMLGIVIATGSQVALRAYTQIVTEADASTLCGTLTEAVCDELRFATQVETDNQGAVTAYLSRQYGAGVRLTADHGRLAVTNPAAPDDPYPLLGEKAYTAGLTCRLALTYADGVFDATLAVVDRDGHTRQETSVSVAPLNP